MTALTESAVEAAALEWLETTGWKVVLEEQLRGTLLPALFSEELRVGKPSMLWR